MTVRRQPPPPKFIRKQTLEMDMLLQDNEIICLKLFSIKKKSMV